MMEVECCRNKEQSQLYQYVNLDAAYEMPALKKTQTSMSYFQVCPSLLCINRIDLRYFQHENQSLQPAFSTDLLWPYQARQQHETKHGGAGKE